MKTDSGKPEGKANPHAQRPAVRIGPPPEKAPATLIMLHGRGGSPREMLTLIEPLEAQACAAIIPQAAGNTWYPHSFLAPLENNQPSLDLALEYIGSMVADLLDHGVAPERIAILGFSQGACLTSEFAARNARRYGALVGFTGGLIGPPGTPRDYPGTFAGTPVFLGSGDPDPHVPFSRVQETAEVLERMGAQVDLRRYPGRPHTVGEDEIAAGRELIGRVIRGE